MDVVVKYGALTDAPLVGEGGVLLTESGQAAVGQRLLAMFPGARLVGPERGQASGYDLVPLAEVDPTRTLILNLDVLDTVGIFQRLHRHGGEPKILNFQWINPSTFHHPVNFAAMGLAYAFFPTFCAGERTAAEVREVLQKWAVAPLVNRARIAWADLGVGTARRIERIPTAEPVVLYPAITMDARKQPEQFISVVTRVQRRTPIQVVARLAQASLVSSPALKLATRKWSTVSPLRAAREEYWTELARTTAFLATSLEEAYGMQYVEAMLAGAIGVFPHRPWALRLLPEGYPYVYDNLEEAEELLLRAVQRPDECRAELDRLVGGSFVDWIRAHHDRQSFEETFRGQVEEWFGPVG